MIFRNYITLIFLTASLTITAQTNADFENFSLAPNSHLNGSDGNGGFASGNIFLPNIFDDNYNFWYGWVVSNSTDNSTVGYTNDFSAITGTGANGTSTYAVSFVLEESIMRVTGQGLAGPVNNMYITNSTYAYFSMLNGDAFAKKFGGASGDDPDYFLLTIRKYQFGELSTDSIEFYLADFRFADNSQDYIIDDWTLVELTSLGTADSLSFTLTSTDVGMFGMNTPAYFCIDEVETTDGSLSSDKLTLRSKVQFYPNPASTVLNLKNLAIDSRCVIYNSIGQQMMEKEINSTADQIDLNAWENGTYILELWNEEHVERHLFVKQ